MGKKNLEEASLLLDIAKNYEKWIENYDNSTQEGIALGESAVQASASGFVEATTYFLAERAMGVASTLAEATEKVAEALKNKGIDVPEETLNLSKVVSDSASYVSKIASSDVDRDFQLLTERKNNLDLVNHTLQLNDGIRNKLELTYRYEQSSHELLITEVKIEDPNGMTLPEVQEMIAGTVYHDVTPDSLIFGLNYENFSGDINAYEFQYGTRIENPQYFTNDFIDGNKIQTGVFPNGNVKVRIENFTTKEVIEYRQNNVTNIVTETIKNSDGHTDTYKYDALTGDSIVEMPDDIGTIPSSEQFQQMREQANKLLGELNQPTIGDETSQYILKSGQTVSHIAAKLDGINSIDLLEYNGLTLEQAKHLPVGFEVKVPKDVTTIQGENGSIKVFENHDGTKSAMISDENNNKIKVDNVEISNDGNQMSYTLDDKAHTLKKDLNGNMYESQVSSDNISVEYDAPDVDGNKQVLSIDITGNTSFDELASLTGHTADELQEFNLYETETISAGDNITTFVSKEMIDGGYGDITQYTTSDGESIFIVPNEDGTSTTYGTFIDGFDNQASYEKSSNGSFNVTLSNEDGSTRVIIANNDGYAFDSYGLEGKVDFTYAQNSDGNTIVSGFTVKENTSYQELVDSGAIPDDAGAFAILNGFDNVFQLADIPAGANLKVPDPGNSFDIDETDTKVVGSINGDYVVLIDGERYSTFDSQYGKAVAHTDIDGNTTIYAPDANGNDKEVGYVTKTGEKFTSKEAYITANESTGSQYGSAIGGQIGSIIISNNEYSNLEKLAISTASTVIVQNIGEYIALENNGIDGSESVDDIGSDTTSAVAGAAVSFAISEYFAHNDNISDILGIDGTFLGD